MTLMSAAPPVATIAARRNRWVHAWRFGLGCIIVAGLAFQFWNGNTRALVELRPPSPVALVLAGAMGTASYFLFLEVWRRLRDRGESWRAMGGVWFASLFARYAPGGLWQGAVRVGSAHVAGESKRAVLERYFAEQALACFSATTLALLLCPFASTLPSVLLLGALAVVAIVALTAALIGPRLGIALQWNASAVLSMLGGHLLMALGFAVVVGALAGSTSASDAASYMVAFLAAGVVGLLAVFVPAGMGVREALLAGLLTPKFGITSAIAIALGARMWLLACEFVAFGLWCLAVRRYRIASSDAPLSCDRESSRGR